MFNLFRKRSVALFASLAMLCATISICKADIIPIPNPTPIPIWYVTCNTQVDNSCASVGAGCGLWGITGECRNQITLELDPDTGEVISITLSCGCV